MIEPYRKKHESKFNFIYNGILALYDEKNYLYIQHERIILKLWH